METDWTEVNTIQVPPPPPSLLHNHTNNHTTNNRFPTFVPQGPLSQISHPYHHTHSHNHNHSHPSQNYGLHGPSGQIPPGSISSCMIFDDHRDLLWVGNGFGRVTSFFGIGLVRYTSYVGHTNRRAQPKPVNVNGSPHHRPGASQRLDAVRQLLVHDKGILSVSATSVHFASRRGVRIWHVEEPEFIDLRCMAYMSRSKAFIVVAGLQDTMFKIDVEKGRIVDRIATSAQYTAMTSSQYISAASPAGSISILDPDTLRLVKAFDTAISDAVLSAQNNYLVVCGWMKRSQGAPMVTTMASVYDLRAMVQLAPIAFHAGAAQVCMHPRMSTTCIIASQNGQLQVVDLMNAFTVNLRQASTSGLLTGMALSSSGEALAISDESGVIHLWGSPTKISFNNFPVQPDFADQIEGLAVQDLDSDIPLSTIGMPYYREQLFSAWSNNELYDVGDVPPKMEGHVQENLRPADVGFWAPNPYKGTRRRNQAYARNRHVSSLPDTEMSVTPKFLSEKARTHDPSGLSPVRRLSEQEAIIDAALSGSTRGQIPVMYRNVEIKYSKFGIEDFDFEYYNRTKFSGLETHILNSYLNPLLQVLKFTPLTRNLALQHTALNCLHETCLLCELGFLFDTLEKAEGQNCQATNFLKALSNVHEAGRLGLLEGQAPSTVPLAEMIQAATRFLLNQISTDFKRMSSEPTAFDSALAVEATSTIRCQHCHMETIRQSSSFVTELQYPTITMQQRQRGQIPPFSQVLKASVETQIQSRGWCDKCRRYQQLRNHKGVRAVPDVLFLNTAIKSNDAKSYWALPGWLPSRIGIIIEGNRFFCFEGEELEGHLRRAMYNVKVYDLVGVVADIDSGENQKSHLVSLIDSAVSAREATDESDWHLFNDFSVRKTAKEDALTFKPSWKLPSVLTFQISTARHKVDDSWRQNLATDLLYREWTMNSKPQEHVVFLDQTTEAPQALDQTQPDNTATPIAIDTEFIAHQDEEIEITSTGERKIIRPTRLGLARVSVLRASGPLSETPFINDYIAITEPIVDHLTQWSGVKDGDLDPTRSSHPLVPLKIAYKKLWLLLNLGCTFIGHGLAKDFRTINIHVPKAQVIDTVELFHSRNRQRKLSLRFLMWYLLQEEIQSGEHDSIEDACAAMKLWKVYLGLKDAGKVDDKIEEIYREGKKWGYKPPGEAQGLMLGNVNVNVQAMVSPSKSEEFGNGTGHGSGGARNAMGHAEEEHENE